MTSKPADESRPASAVSSHEAGGQVGSELKIRLRWLPSLN